VTPAFEHSCGVLYTGNALTVLRELPEASVNCCVTSVPYWGLRDYGTARWEGGSADCDHVYNHGVQGKSGDRADRTFTGQALYKTECGKCGARRIDEQLGLEATPEEYIAKMVEVFREVHRVLREDATCWVNVGDSYCSGTGGDRLPTTPAGGRVPSSWSNRAQPQRMRPVSGIKTKDLVGTPWMLAFALRADGWFLRSEIIWHKPNPLPESVRDRPTKSHEQIFLLAKSECYWYDADAIKEKSAWPDGPNSPESILSPYGQGFTRAAAGWLQGSRGSQNGATAPRDKRSTKVHDNLPGRSDGGAAYNKPGQEMRNKRSVWTVPTEAFPGAHFATFPQALIKPCILAGCPAGGTVLDPFSGAGTTALVAKENGRRFIGIDLNPAYNAMAAKRLAQEMLPLSAEQQAVVVENSDSTSTSEPEITA